jgi:hypothetical protein
MVAAGDKIRASDFTDLFARKTATESVTSSTTLQDDDELTVTVEADSVYVVTAVLQYDAATAGDIKFAFSAPASATLDWAATVAPTTSTTATAPGTVNFNGSDISTTYGAGGIGAGSRLSATAVGLLVVAGTAGTFKLQWAQFASSATATRVFAGSFLHLRKVA